MKKTADAARFAVTGGLFVAISAIVVSAAITLFLAIPTGAFTNYKEETLGFFVLCMFTSIPAGLIGFVCGCLGSAWLHSRARHFTSFGRLLGEAVVMGLLLSLLVAGIYRMLGWGANVRDSLFSGPWLLLYCFTTGLLCSILFAIVFAQTLVQKSDTG